MRVACHLRNRALCGGCSGSRCVDKPSQTKPLLFECPVCEGTGANEKCRACAGVGRFKVTACPHEGIASDIWELIRGADWVAQGAWPNGRGWLDEAACFVDGVRIVQNEDAFARNAKRPRD